MQYLPASALPGVTRGAGTARNNYSTGITQERQKNTGRRIGAATSRGRGL